VTLGPNGRGNDGKDFIIAGARLSLTDMRTLRDSIDAFITAVGEEDI
jgi:hypothetical protein